MKEFFKFKWIRKQNLLFLLKTCSLFRGQSPTSHPHSQSEIHRSLCLKKTSEPSVSSLGRSMAEQ